MALVYQSSLFLIDQNGFIEKNSNLIYQIKESRILWIVIFFKQFSFNIFVLLQVCFLEPYLLSLKHFFFEFLANLHVFV